MQKAAKITFVVQRDNSAEIVYQKGVKELSEGEAKVKSGKIIVDGSYKTGDIIVVDTDGNDIDEIYKLRDASAKDGQTRAKYTDPKAGEVYKKVDVFYYDDVDFSEAQIDENALVGVLNETGILEAFTDEVYAVTKNNIEVTTQKSKKGGYEFTVLIKDPKDEKKQLKITFGIKAKLLVEKDSRTIVADSKLKLTDNLEFSISGEGKKETEEKIKKALKKFRMKKEFKKGKSDYDVPLLPINIPIAGPISAYIDLGLTAEMSFSAEFNAGVDAKAVFSQGIIYDTKKHKVVKKYGNVSGDVDAHMMVQGDLDAFAGAYAEAGIEIPLLAKAGINAVGGPYLAATGCFTIKGIPKDIKSNGYYKAEIGLRLAVEGKVKLLTAKEKTFDIVEMKKVLFEKSNYMRLKGADIEDTYYKDSTGVIVNKISALYYNVIEDQVQKKPIKRFNLYIDGSKVKVEDGYVTKNISVGKHKFKIEWTYKGKKEEYTKTVTVEKEDVTEEAFAKLRGVWTRKSAGSNVRSDFIEFAEEDGEKTLASGLLSVSSFAAGKINYCKRTQDGYLFNVAMNYYDPGKGITPGKNVDVSVICSKDLNSKKTGWIFVDGASAEKYTYKASSLRAIGKVFFDFRNDLLKGEGD